MSASNRFRLPQGGRIDRQRRLEFAFNGQLYQGYQGDTVASALLANGVHLVGRSWKYHRPRGIVGSGAEEPNALLQLNEGMLSVPNARATQVELFQGLRASSVNCWPSLRWDLLAVNQWFSRFMPAGFYYKTFMWPKSWWMKYERIIRNAAGLGQAPVTPDPDTYDKLYAYCDVLVAGAGPAGLAAALAAARTGARVVIADEQSEFGGTLLSSRDTLNGQPASVWIEQVVAELRSLPNVTLLPRATVYGYLDHNFLAIAEKLSDHLPPGALAGPRERLWRVRTKQVVLATGAHERPLVFSNNDRPGVMLASAVSSYINRYAVRPGSRAVVFTNNDSAYATALDLLEAGVALAAVVDARANPQGEPVQQLRARGVEVLANSVVVNVLGQQQVQAVEVRSLSADARSLAKGSTRRIACDLVANSGGWSPVLHLSAQSGAKALWDEQRACFMPGKPVQAERSVGAANGEWSLSGALQQGWSAGVDAVQLAGWSASAQPDLPTVVEPVVEPLRPLWLVPGDKPSSRLPKAFVDLQNDVAASDLQLAAREGFQSIEHVKRYTAMGFGTDQGKLGNINGMAIVAQTLGLPIPEVGTTTFRPNYTPVTFGTIAGPDLGDLLDPIRKTALHQWHVEHGAEWENVGQWKRPWYFPKAGEDLHAAVNRECLAARNGVAIMDASTLGKIDIQGPDAATFLNWVYTNQWDTLKVGQCRYGLMLDENGMVMDDGVTVRLSEQHFYMTTTTGGAARVMAWLERWLQTEWPHLQVYLTSQTDHWATMALVGPKSRALLEQLCSDIDFSSAAFPFMTYRNGTVAGVAARVMRVSFSGELAYEVNVPANHARGVWEALMQAGQPYDITPYGTETMHVLRAEKGFIIVGQDTDGSVTPIDLGMQWIVSKKKDFLGKRSLSRSDTTRTNRKQLVGLLTEDPHAVLPEGAQMVKDPHLAAPIPMEGHVTSSYYSANLGRSIAMAVIKGGQQRVGETLYAPLADGRVIKATISRCVFIDDKGREETQPLREFLQAKGGV